MSAAIWTPPHLWMPPRGLTAAMMAHLKRGAGGHLLKNASGHLVTSCDEIPGCADQPTSFSAVGSGFGMTQFNGAHTLDLLDDPCFGALCQWQHTISDNECDTPVNRVAIYFDGAIWNAFVEDTTSGGLGFKAGPDTGTGPTGTYTLVTVLGTGGDGTLVVS